MGLFLLSVYDHQIQLVNCYVDMESCRYRTHQHFGNNNHYQLEDMHQVRLSLRAMLW